MSLKTSRTKLRRERAKGSYEPDSLYAVLDSVPMCHFGYVHDGVPFVTPTLQWREGDFVYWHGSIASRAIQQALEQTVCLTVTRFDGLVLARSAFHHSANFASAMILGQPERVNDPAEKEHHLERFMEQLIPGRWHELRPIKPKEVKATEVLRIPLNEASVKMRAGDPIEDKGDRTLPIWAGVLPVAWHTGTPIPDPYNAQDMPLPAYLDGYEFQRDE